VRPCLAADLTRNRSVGVDAEDDEIDREERNPFQNREERLALLVSLAVVSQKTMIGH
jgi:glycerol-3-phosphate cytidylyltransferase-like family protein